MKISVVIRTLNEARRLAELLTAIQSQEVGDAQIEIVVVDSGSTDGTLAIASGFACRVVHIGKADFTFGRSLNLGCNAATGDILVFVSGHCVPTDSRWLSALIAPIIERKAGYTYGRQLGRDTTRFSERQVFAKYFPAASRLPQEGFFCNNANAALLRTLWVSIQFDETLTGLEDLKLAKDLVSRQHKVGYVAEATVYHIHDESWRQVLVRYEREALALREIMPEIHVSFLTFLRYFLSGVTNDAYMALGERSFLANIKSIVLFRLMQFWGTYRGNREHRQISARSREEFFFPIEKRRKASAGKVSRTSAHKSS